jgi:hypothetical protein
MAPKMYFRKSVPEPKSLFGGNPITRGATVEFGGPWDQQVSAPDKGNPNDQRCRFGRCDHVCAEVPHEAADRGVLEPNAANWPRS